MPLGFKSAVCIGAFTDWLLRGLRVGHLQTSLCVYTFVWLERILNILSSALLTAKAPFEG